MTLIFTVTNDLSYDQRMHRICGTLAEAGHDALLIGRTLPHSIALKDRTFRQHRLRCRFRRGFAFYAEYNLRLFFFLMKTPCDVVCSIDLDTLPAGWLATGLRGKRRVFDAHEYFSEVPEVAHRPGVKFFWEMVARICLPAYRQAYTVGPSLAGIFQKKYGIPFGVVRNVPLPAAPSGNMDSGSATKTLLYQGALNLGRGLEPLLHAMRHLDGVHLLLAGEGDCSADLRRLAADLQVLDRVTFLGYVEPEALRLLTAQAWLGLNLLENRGLSYYYSLANKFFDYVQARVPVLTMRFPEYQALNSEHEVALLLDDLHPDTIAAAVAGLLEQPAHYQYLQDNCCRAREVWNWEREKEALLKVWELVL